jgi:V8-like Glu-specific endopeptidase
MALTFRSRLSLIVLIAVSCGGVGAAAAAPRGAATAGAGYWTRYRMEHAVPMGPDTQGAGGITTKAATGGAVVRDTGKVFFTLDSTDYVCSGAAVGGPSAAVVVTAAHCVTDGYGGWATNWVFIPGYDNGDKPYGSFSSRRFFVSRQWNAGMDETYDVAFVAVSGLSGGLPIGFDANPGSVYVFGYPAEPPYTGNQLRYCDGPVAADPDNPGGDVGVSCGMTAGDSGGPWLTGYTPAAGTGTVVGVSAFKYSDNDQVLYGVLFGRTARELYREALTAR